MNILFILRLNRSLDFLLTTFSDMYNIDFSLFLKDCPCLVNIDLPSHLQKEFCCYLRLQLLKEPSACITSEQSGSKAARLHVAGDSALCAGRGSWMQQIKPDTMGHAAEVTNEDWGDHEIMRPRLNRVSPRTLPQFSVDNFLKVA